MATYSTDYYTDQSEKDIRRNAAAKISDAQQPLKSTGFRYTLAGTEANTEYIQLGDLGIKDGTFIPELSRVINEGTGDADLDVKIQKRAADGTVTVLTAAASIDNATVPFVRVANQVQTFTNGDVFEVLIAAIPEAVTAGEDLVFELVYRCAIGNG